MGSLKFDFSMWGYFTPTELAFGGSAKIPRQERKWSVTRGESLLASSTWSVKQPRQLRTRVWWMWGHVQPVHLESTEETTRDDISH